MTEETQTPETEQEQKKIDVNELFAQVHAFGTRVTVNLGDGNYVAIVPSEDYEILLEVDKAMSEETGPTDEYVEGEGA